MKLFALYLGLALAILSFPLHAQQLDRLYAEFYQDGELLKYGAIGGLKSPQISAADLDNDGDKDLFIFDKAGDVVLTFRNDGSPDEFDYAFDPSLSRNFPPLADWALLRDFDGDGAVDIFAQLNSPVAQGIEVWKGEWLGDVLGFERVVFPELSIGAIPVPSSNGNFTQLYVSTQDIPAIEDIDEDGDLDILTFGPVGGVVYFFQNLAQENGNGPGLEFKLVDDCWGKFFESGISGCLELSDDATTCSEGYASDGDQKDGGIHAGSTLALFDNDGDGDKDLLLGDITFNNLVLAINASTPTDSYVDDQDCSYPSYDIATDLVIFPAAYFVDINNDDKRDLLVSPNAENNSEDLNGLWYYKNTNTDASPVFSLQQKDLIISEAFDGGRGANPAIVDYNGDGLLDLVIGNLGYFVSGGGKDARLQLLINTGTADAPEYTLEDDDWLGFSDLFFTTPSIFNFAPTFGDLDGDGDMDLFLGDNSGRITFVENTAGPGAVMTMNPPVYNWMNLKAGSFTVPTLADVNRDGLLDFIIGEKAVNVNDDGTVNSSFNLLVNKGTSTEPSFDPDFEAEGNTELFGQVNTQDIGFTDAQSAPAMWDTGDDFILFSGSSSGKIKVYTEIQDNLDGEFTTYSSAYGNINVGTNTRVAVNDLNNDGILDLVIGNKRGGIDIFVTTFNIDGTVGVNSLPQLENVSLYPNPVSDQLFIENNGSYSLDVQIYDAVGRRVEAANAPPGSLSIPVNSFAAGIYFVKMQSQEGVLTEKVIIQ